MRLKIIAFLVAFSTVFSLQLAPASAFNFFGSTCSGKAATSAACESAADPGSNGSTPNPVVNIINSTATIIAIVTGVAAVIMIIIGGIGMISSGGNSEAVAAGRRRIIYSAVGLVVVALTYTIIRFITDRIV